MKSPVFTADPEACETNMVVIQIQDGIDVMTACRLLGNKLDGEEATFGQAIHVKIFPFSNTSLRAVLHQDISTEDVDWILKKIKFVSDLMSGSEKETVLAGLKKMSL